MRKRSLFTVAELWHAAQIIALREYLIALRDLCWLTLSLSMLFEQRANVPQRRSWMVFVENLRKHVLFTVTELVVSYLS